MKEETKKLLEKYPQHRYVLMDMAYEIVTAICAKYLEEVPEDQWKTAAYELMFFITEFRTFLTQLDKTFRKPDYLV